VPLVKAVQELSKMSDEKDLKIQSQEKKIEEQDKKIDALMVMMQSLQQNFNSCNPCGDNTSSQSEKIVLGSNIFLEQNIPNPFNHTTTISYTLPQQYSSAKIIVVDKSGKVLKEVNISGSGKGSLKIDAATLASGAYNYSLYVNGRLISSKQMMLAK